MKNKKGIVLITTMIIIVVIIMIVTLLVTSMQNGLSLSKNYSDSEQAQYAALSGLEYARSMVFENSNWMQVPNSNTRTIGIDENTINIVENGTIVRAYVEGTAQNNRAKFSMAFLDISSITSSSGMNSTDYNEKVINLAQAAEIPDDIKYVSCNALSKTNNYCVLKRDTNGNFKIYKNDIPANTMYIVCQGTSNSVTKYAEALIDVRGISDFSTSSIARGDINVNLVGSNPSVVIKAKTQESTSLRSYNNISIVSEAENNNCFALENDGYAYARKISINNENIYANQNNRANNYGININTSTSELLKTDKMLESGGSTLTFDSLANTAAEGTMEPGAYIYIPSGASGEWHYIEKVDIVGENKDIIMNRSDSGHPIRPASQVSHGGMLLNTDGTVSVTNEVICKGNLFLGIGVDVSQQSNNAPLSDFMLATDKRLKINFTGGNSSIQVEGPNGSQADLVLHGELTGKGKIYSNGNVYFQGGSFFDTEIHSGVSVFAEQDIKVVASTTTEYTATLNQISNFLQSIWHNWAEAANETKYKTIDSAANNLLDYNHNGSNLKQLLTELGCVNNDDRQNFAKMLILKNSAMVGGDIDTTPIEVGFLDMLTATNNSSTIPLYTGATNQAVADPYTNTYFQNYLWETNSEPGNQISISINCITSGYEQQTRNSGNNQEKISYYTNYPGPVIEIWIHQVKNGATRPNDLFIYIPIIDDPRAQITAKMGFSRNFEATENNSLVMQSAVNDPVTGWPIHQINNKNYYEGELYGLLSRNFFEYDSNDASLLKVRLYDVISVLKNQGEYYQKNPSSTSYSKQNLNGSEILTSLKEIENALETFNYTKQAFNMKRNSFEDFVIKLAGNDIDSIGYINGIPGTFKGTFGTEEYLAIKENLETDTLPNVNDTIVRGMLFTRKGDFNADSARGTITIIGGIVAYGQDYDMTNGGNIIVNNCAGLNLCYDPDYMAFFYGRTTLTGYLYRVTY